MEWLKYEGNDSRAASLKGRRVYTLKAYYHKASLLMAKNSAHCMHEARGFQV
jgi:hypothetical protein